MDPKKLKIEPTTVTRDMTLLHKPTGNVYETVAIISKRANQVGKELKEELDRKLNEFAVPSDNLEEVFENREQIEIARYYENLPKPTLIAVNEFLKDEIHFENPEKAGKPNAF